VSANEAVTSYVHLPLLRKWWPEPSTEPITVLQHAIDSAGTIAHSPLIGRRS
jgi:hypothetical protein